MRAVQIVFGGSDFTLGILLGDGELLVGRLPATEPLWNEDPTYAQWIPSLRRGLLLLSIAFYALHFLHLSADFPAGTDWNDWSRYTDEGWYSDAAVRHALLGHWYVQGDFNPAVALPVWPLLEALAFGLAGPSLTTARALTVVVFGVMLLGVYRLLSRFAHDGKEADNTLAAPLAVFFLCTSPFFYAFERTAILEPVEATLSVLALLAAFFLAPLQEWSELPRRQYLLPALALGILLPAMVLTKPTAVTIFPAIAFILWQRGGKRFAPLLRMATLPVLLAVTIWGGYLFGLVRPHYMEDYRYLFDANEYTSFQTDPLSRVAFYTVTDGVWIGAVLYPLFFLLIAAFSIVRPRFFRGPLVPALLLWVGGYLVFLGYHNNPQTRYYLLLAVPITCLMAMALDELLKPGDRASESRILVAIRWGFVSFCGLAISVPDAVEQVRFCQHPTYSFVRAAKAIATRVRAEPMHPALILSVSGSDLTLMTGLPSINTEFGTLDLDQRVKRYKPGWYVAWNEVEDEDMKAIAPFYGLTPVASYPAMDDPDRNILLLYRLDPKPTAQRGGSMSGVR